MSRRLLLLLCILLVPVILVASTGEANALETEYGDPVDFSFDIEEEDTPVWDSGGGGPWLVCDGVAAYEVVRAGPGAPMIATIFGELECYFEQSYAADPGPDDMKDNDWTLLFSGKDGNDEDCVAEDHTNGDINNGWAFQTDLAVSHDCVIDQVCVDGHATRVWLFSPDVQWNFYDCVMLPLGAQPDVDPGRGDCAFGNPTEIYTESAPADPPFEPHYGHDIQAWFTRPGNVTHKGWLFDARYPTVTGGNTPGTKVWRNGSFNESPPRTWTIDGDLAWWRQNMPAGSGNLYQNTDRGAEDAVGVWVWATDPAAPGDQANWRTANGLTIINEYTYGDTDPENCVFYLGPKFRDDPDSTLDEPWGTLETDLGTPTPPDTSVEPPTDRGGCDFSITDPETWAAGALCALVELFRKMIRLLDSILAAIKGLVGALLDGIAALFIPEDGFMEAQLEAAQDAWEGTPPFVVLEGLGEVTSGLVIDPGSSCQGPPLTFTEPVGSNTVTVHPFAACSGGMAQLASIVHTALTVMIYIGAYSGGLRVISHVFGVDAKFSTGRGM